MIIDEFIEVKINSTNFKWYMNRGYGPFKKNDIIKVKVDDMSKGSAVKIRVRCDICGKENYIKYYGYLINIKNCQFYSCVMCKNHKAEITNMEKYGHKYGLQSKEVQEKSKKTCMDKYGVDNISKVESIKENRRDNFKKDNFKKKSKETWIEKYGVDNPSKSEQIKEKKIKTTLKNWGVENPTQSYILFEKEEIRNTIGFLNNNWFEFRVNGEYEELGDVCYEYDEAMESAKIMLDEND